MQSTIAACLVTKHGRATPLVWFSDSKDVLTAGGRTGLETLVLHRLRDVLPPDCKVTLLADRGFGDHADTKGVTRPAKARGAPTGRMKEPWALATSAPTSLHPRS